MGTETIRTGDTTGTDRPFTTAPMACFTTGTGTADGGTMATLMTGAATATASRAMPPRVVAFRPRKIALRKKTVNRTEKRHTRGTIRRIMQNYVSGTAKRGKRTDE